MVLARDLKHVRPVVPLDFPDQEPEDERMGQSGRHFEMCVALYQILRAAAGPEHTVACDQFLYFDASNPKRCLAPDASVKLGVAQHAFDSWKTWEGGAPELAVEILSPRESPERWTFDEKLERYRAVGVRELVVYQVEGEPGSRVRAYDRIDGDLVERVVEDEKTPCLTLGMTFVLAPVDVYPACLRIARDREGNDLVATPAEERDQAEARLQQAERRIAELEGRQEADAKR